MTSSLGWIVLDDRHKRDVMETIALFREPGTVDELGIGTVRDVFSDLLFPGRQSFRRGPSTCSSFRGSSTPSGAEGPRW